MVWLNVVAMPSALWQWIGIFCGIAALVLGVMAVPSILQMVFGRPRVDWDFERNVDGQERQLGVFLKNPPISNAFLKRLHVRRDAVQSLTGTLRISEAGSSKILVPILQITFYSDETLANPQGMNRIFLPPTQSVGASFPIVQWDNKDKRASVVPDPLRKKFELAPGYYQERSFSQLMEYLLTRLPNDLWLEVKLTTLSGGHRSGVSNGVCLYAHCQETSSS
jgi:hypothetical protein